MDKRGIGFSVISSLLLGLVLLVIVLIWISEVGQDTDWDVCRNSIIIRNSIPEIDVEGSTVASFKDSYPLNCKTQVIKIDYEDSQKAKKEIMDAIASCWHLMDRGSASIFPSGFLLARTSCFTCARVHFTSNVREFYTENPIYLEEALNENIQSEISYRSYLTNEGNNPFLSRTGENFEVIDDDIEINLKEDWWDFIKYGFWGAVYLNRAPGLINFPKEIDPNQGFYITVNSWVLNSEKTLNQILLYHYDEIDELSNKIYLPSLNEEGSETTRLKYPLCNNWDGIPA